MCCKGVFLLFPPIFSHELIIWKTRIRHFRGIWGKEEFVYEGTFASEFHFSLLVLFRLEAVWITTREQLSPSFPQPHFYPLNTYLSLREEFLLVFQGTVLIISSCWGCQQLPSMSLLPSHLFFCSHYVFYILLLTIFVSCLHIFLLDSEILEGKDHVFF